MSDAHPPDAIRKQPPQVERSYEATAELKGVRHIELKSISERLDHVAAVSRAKKWEVRSEVTFGLVAAGILGAIPFGATNPSFVLIVGYVLVVAAVGIVCRLCWRAGKDVAEERADSVVAIKEHIDKTMLSTDTPLLQAPTGARRLGLGASAQPPEDQSPPPSSLAAD